MPKPENNTAPNKDGVNPEDATTPKDKDAAAGEEKDTGFEWGFEDLLGGDDSDDGQDESKSKKDSLNEDDKEIDKVAALEEELKAERRQRRIQEDFTRLKSKYSKYDHYPKVDKRKIMKFMNSEYGNISPIEVGYIMSNFKDIIKATESKIQTDSENYKVEVTAQRKQKETKERLGSIREKLAAKMGLSKKKEEK